MNAESVNRGSPARGVLTPMQRGGRQLVARARHVGTRFGFRLAPLMVLLVAGGCAPYDPDLFAYRALNLGRRVLVQALGFAMFG